MEAKFKEFMGNEAERLDRDVKHADEKSAAEAESRAARRRAEWRAICKSRDQQLNSRKAQKLATLDADKAFAAAWKASVITPTLHVLWEIYTVLNLLLAVLGTDGRGCAEEGSVAGKGTAVYIHAWHGRKCTCLESPWNLCAGENAAAG